MPGLVVSLALARIDTRGTGFRACYSMAATMSTVFAVALRAGFAGGGGYGLGEVALLRLVMIGESLITSVLGSSV